MNNNNNNSNNYNNNNNSGNNLQAMLDKIKSKVTNPYLKDNLTVENIANFFANFISGNSFVNNLEVKDIAEFNKVEVKDDLKVKGEASFEKITFNKIKNKALTISDNEIVFDPEATIKLRNNKIAFKVKDVFEVITFMKYIVKICGSKLEKCDFNNLLKNHSANQIMQIVRTFQKKIDETQKKALEFQEKTMKEITIKEEKIKKEEEEKKEKKIKEIHESKNDKSSQVEKKSSNSIASGNNNKNLRGTSPLNNGENSNSNGIKNKTNNISNINGSQGKISEDDLITKQFTFKEKDFIDIEKDLNQDFMFKQTNDSFEDYSKFLENPQISEIMNSYYYSIPQPQYGLGMNNMMAPPQF